MSNHLGLLLIIVVISGALCTHDYVIMSECADNKALHLAPEGTVSVTDISQSQIITLIGHTNFMPDTPFKVALYANDTKKYLCFNESWILVGMERLTNFCYFTERINHGYFVFESIVDVRRRVGFTDKGVAIGPEGYDDDKCYHFNKIAADDFIYRPLDTHKSTTTDPLIPSIQKSNKRNKNHKVNSNSNSNKRNRNKNKNNFNRNKNNRNKNRKYNFNNNNNNNNNTNISSDKNSYNNNNNNNKNNNKIGHISNLSRKNNKTMQLGEKNESHQQHSHTHNQHNHQHHRKEHPDHPIRHRHDDPFAMRRRQERQRKHKQSQRDRQKQKLRQIQKEKEELESKAQAERLKHNHTNISKTINSYNNNNKNKNINNNITIIKDNIHIDNNYNNNNETTTNVTSPLMNTLSVATKVTPTSQLQISTPTIIPIALSNTTIPITHTYTNTNTNAKIHLSNSSKITTTYTSTPIPIPILNPNPPPSSPSLPRSSPLAPLPVLTATIATATKVEDFSKAINLGDSLPSKGISFTKTPIVTNGRPSVPTMTTLNSNLQIDLDSVTDDGSRDAPRVTLAGTSRTLTTAFKEAVPMTLPSALATLASVYSLSSNKTTPTTTTRARARATASTIKAHKRRGQRRKPKKHSPIAHSSQNEETFALNFATETNLSSNINSSFDLSNESENSTLYSTTPTYDPFESFLTFYHEYDNRSMESGGVGGNNSFTNITDDDELLNRNDDFFNGNFSLTPTNESSTTIDSFYMNSIFSNSNSINENDSNETFASTLTSTTTDFTKKSSPLAFNSTASLDDEVNFWDESTNPDDILQEILNSSQSSSFNNFNDLEKVEELEANDQNFSLPTTFENKFLAPTLSNMNMFSLDSSSSADEEIETTTSYEEDYLNSSASILVNNDQSFSKSSPKLLLSPKKPYKAFATHMSPTVFSHFPHILENSNIDSTTSSYTEESSYSSEESPTSKSSSRKLQRKSQQKLSSREKRKKNRKQTQIAIDSVPSTLATHFVQQNTNSEKPSSPAQGERKASTLSPSKDSKLFTITHLASQSSKVHSPFLSNKAFKDLFSANSRNALTPSATVSSPQAFTESFRKNAFKEASPAFTNTKAQASTPHPSSATTKAFKQSSLKSSSKPSKEHSSISSLKALPNSTSTLQESFSFQPTLSTFQSSPDPTTKKTLRKVTQKLYATPFHQITYVKNEAGDIEIDNIDNISVYPDDLVDEIGHFKGYLPTLATSTLSKPIQIAKKKYNNERKRRKQHHQRLRRQA